MVGEDIPYVKLGHRNLEEFLMTVDSLTTCRGPSGEMLIDAKGSKETAHLTDMINRQKSTKKKWVATAYKNKIRLLQESGV